MSKRPVALDHVSTEELIQEALTISDEEDDRFWEIIRFLHLNRQDAFEPCVKLCKDPSSQARRLGVDILSQLGLAEKEFDNEILELLLKMLKTETDDDVLYAIGVANSHRNFPELIEPLALLANHPNDMVRYGVIAGMAGQLNDLAITTLIRLTEDEDTENRDWATFDLGSQIDLDTPAIRDALFARVSDTDVVVRGEALVGLARRRDERVVNALLHELEYEKGDELAPVQIVEAADEIRDARLYSALVKFREDINWEHIEYTKQDLDALIEALKSMIDEVKND